ncbi:MAG: LacI family DNA-binding transcriptional regulator [Actinomycetota bacterium]
MARLSSTSRSTASRALNNDSRISSETTERVRLVAAALGYRPNVAARTLSTGRSGIIGLILPVGQLTGEPYGAQLVSAVTTAAAVGNHAVMLWLSHREPSGAVHEVLQNGLVDGLVISIVAQEDPWVNVLLDGPLPCSLIGRHTGRDDLSYASIDNITSTRELMAHLLEQGYQRMAMIRGPIGNADADERYAVFAEALGGEAAIDANLVVVGKYDYDSGYQCAEALLRRRPDCIVAANDHMALGAIDAVLDAGLSVPHDVAVTGWDDMREISRPTIGLTTVRQDVEAVGREATLILLELLGGAAGPIQRTLPTAPVIRDSTLRRTPISVGGGSKTP